MPEIIFTLFTHDLKPLKMVAFNTLIVSTKNTVDLKYVAPIWRNKQVLYICIYSMIMDIHHVHIYTYTNEYEDSLVIIACCIFHTI